MLMLEEKVTLRTHARQQPVADVLQAIQGYVCATHFRLSRQRI